MGRGVGPFNCRTATVTTGPLRGHHPRCDRFISTDSVMTEFRLEDLHTRAAERRAVEGRHLGYAPGQRGCHASGLLPGRSRVQRLHLLVQPEHVDEPDDYAQSLHQLRDVHQSQERSGGDRRSGGNRAGVVRHHHQCLEWAAAQRRQHRLRQGCRSAVSGAATGIRRGNARSAGEQGRRRDRAATATWPCSGS